MTRAYPEELYDEVVTMLEEGYTVAEISEETGWATGTIYKIRREAGFRGRVIDPLKGIDTDAVVEDYRTGDMTNRELMEKHNLKSTKYIYKILTLVGEPVRRRDPYLQEVWQKQLDEACEMYEKGYPIHQIEVEAGVSQVTIHKELRKRGIKFRRERT